MDRRGFGSQAGSLRHSRGFALLELLLCAFASRSAVGITGFVGYGVLEDSFPLASTAVVGYPIRKMNRTCVLAATRIGIGATLMVGVAQAAFFSNGSFETGTAPGSYSTVSGGDSTTIASWEVTGHSVDYIGSYWTASDGARSLDLDGNGIGGIRQTFDTTNGLTYNVTFDMSGNPDGPPDPKLLEASAGNFTGTFSRPKPSSGSMNWYTYSFSFTAQSSSTTLAFKSLTPTSQSNPYYGAALDNVTVTPVPEPFTMALAGCALAAAVRRRRAVRSS